jgi:hypothetical protein
VRKNGRSAAQKAAVHGIAKNPLAFLRVVTTIFKMNDETRDEFARHMAAAFIWMQMRVTVESAPTEQQQREQRGATHLRGRTRRLCPMRVTAHGGEASVCIEKAVEEN